MMNSILLHPAIPIFLGAILALSVKGISRNLILLFMPFISLAFIWIGPEGVVFSINYMEWTLEPFKVDKLSRLFATVFVIMAFAGNLYAMRQERLLEIFAANIYISFSLCVVFAGDMITVFVFWEMMALASATVIFSNNNPPFEI